MTIRIIDCETTGIDPGECAIVEVACCDLVRDANGAITITRQYESLVNPDRPIPPEASAVHHIIDADVVAAPHLAEVLPHVHGADYYVAHNADFEQALLGDLVGRAAWVCTYKCALRLWPKLGSHKNQAIRYQLGLAAPFGIDRLSLVPHRALSDVIVTAAILAEMVRLVRWSQLLDWSAEPPLHTVLDFGMYRGRRYDAVDPGYLEWVQRQPDMRPDRKHSARYWLDHRQSGGPDG